jgi:TDG/mug DNA glycosylase family protein
VLKRNLLRCSPRIVCFHGNVAYRNYLKQAEGVDEKPELGLQPRSIGRSRVFLVPNSSPANAVYSMADLVGWYRQLGAFRDELESAP